MSPRGYPTSSRDGWNELIESLEQDFLEHEDIESESESDSTEEESDHFEDKDFDERLCNLVCEVADMMIHHIQAQVIESSVIPLSLQLMQTPREAILEVISSFIRVAMAYRCLKTHALHPEVGMHVTTISGRQCPTVEDAMWSVQVTVWIKPNRKFGWQVVWKPIAEQAAPAPDTDTDTEQAALPAQDTNTDPGYYEGNLDLPQSLCAHFISNLHESVKIVGADFEITRQLVGTEHLVFQYEGRRRAQP